MDHLVVNLIVWLFSKAISKVGNMAISTAIWALKYSIGAPPPSSDLVPRPLITETVTAAGTTIFSHLPERTLYLPRATDTTPPPSLSLDPYVPPGGTADTPADMPDIPAAVAILLLLVTLFGVWHLLRLAYSVLRRLSKGRALRPDESLTVRFAYPKEHEVDLIRKEVTDFDAVWAYANSLPYVFHDTKAREEIRERDEKIVEEGTKLLKRDKELHESAEEIKGLKSRLRITRDEVIDLEGQLSDRKNQDGDSESQDSDSEDPDSDLQLQISALDRLLDITQSELDAEKKQNKSLRLQQVSLSKRLNARLGVSNEATEKCGLDKTKLQSELDKEKKKNVTLNGRLMANKKTHTDTSTSGSEETKEIKKAAAQDHTQGLEEEKAPVAPAPVSDDPEAQSQLPKSKVAPGTAAIDDGASEVPVPDEIELGDEETKESTAEDDLANAGDKQDESDDEPHSPALGSDDGLFSSDDEDDDDPRGPGASGIPDRSNIWKLGEHVDNGEHGQPTERVQDPSQEPIRISTPLPIDGEEPILILSPTTEGMWDELVANGFKPPPAQPPTSADLPAQPTSTTEEPPLRPSTPSQPAKKFDPDYDLSPIEQAKTDARKKAKRDAENGGSAVDGHSITGGPATMDPAPGPSTGASQSQPGDAVTNPGATPAEIAREKQLEADRLRKIAAGEKAARQEERLKEKKAKKQEKKSAEKKEKADKETADKETADKETAENERVENERVESERVENERVENERAENERVENERAENERAEKKKADVDAEMVDAPPDPSNHQPPPPGEDKPLSASEIAILRGRLADSDSDSDMDTEETSQTSANAPSTGDTVMGDDGPVSNTAPSTTEQIMQDAPPASVAMPQVSSLDFSSGLGQTSAANPFQGASAGTGQHQSGEDGSPRNVEQTTTPPAQWNYGANAFSDYGPSPATQAKKDAEEKQAADTAQQESAASARRSNAGFNVSLESTSQGQFDEDGYLRILPQTIPPPPQQVPEPSPPVENPPAAPRKVLNARGPKGSVVDKRFQGDPDVRLANVQNVPEVPARPYNHNEKAFLDALEKRNRPAESQGQTRQMPTPKPASNPELQPRSRGNVRTRRIASTRSNPFFGRRLSVNERNQDILAALRAANHLFLQWNEDTKIDDIRHLCQDHNSVLNDHWENIRDAEEWFTSAQKLATNAAPEFYQLRVLREMESFVDTLVSHLAELTDMHNLNVVTFSAWFKVTLQEVRRIQVILKDAIAKNLKRNSPSQGEAEPAPKPSSSQAKTKSKVSRQFRSARPNPWKTMTNIHQRNQNILDALDAANLSFDELDENTEAEDIEPFYQDGSSEFHDHFEHIRWAFEVITSLEDFGTNQFSLHVLCEMRRELNGLQTHLEELTNPESVMYHTYIAYFETTLAQARTMWAAMDTAIYFATL
jgi:hypothetical protein